MEPLYAVSAEAQGDLYGAALLCRVVCYLAGFPQEFTSRGKSISG